MKRLIVLLTAIAAVSVFNLQAFAANQYGQVLQNPMLIDTSGFAVHPTGNDSSDRADIQRDVVQNPMLVDTQGIAAYSTRDQNSDEHYGIAPAWGGREGKSAAERLNNPMLQGVFDNTGN